VRQLVGHRAVDDLAPADSKYFVGILVGFWFESDGARYDCEIPNLELDFGREEGKAGCGRGEWHVLLHLILVALGQQRLSQRYGLPRRESWVTE
jgi:hypothetical protein